MSDEQAESHKGTEQVTVWPWGAAPMKYEKLSDHGGDEDWVVLVPKAMREWWLPGGLNFIVSGDEKDYLTGWGHADRHELENGDVVIIFAHA